MPDNTGARLLGVRAVTMLYCPCDAELGVPLYLAPCRFARAHFQETLAAGYWPDGSVWRYAAQYRGAPTLWRVSGACLLEVGGSRALRARLKTDDHVCVELVVAADAAKGVT